MNHTIQFELDMLASQRPDRAHCAMARVAAWLALVAAMWFTSSNACWGEESESAGPEDAPSIESPLHPTPAEEVFAPSLADDFVPSIVYEPSYANLECNRRCDTIGPCSPCRVRGFHCVGRCCCRGKGCPDWEDAGPIPWEAFAQGEYIGPVRLPHVPEYRLRVDDRLDFVFRLTRDVSAEAYRLDVGDVIKIESLMSPEQNREALIQPDGTIVVGLVGSVRAAGLSIPELRQALQDEYEKYIKEPAITVSPVKISTKLEELRATVDNRFGDGGQSRSARVTPEGTIQLPAVGTVPAHGLTLRELKREIDARYSKIVDGLEVTPILSERAPRYIFVVGEVKTPGRFALEGPTTVMQSIALAGGWNVGAHLRHVVVFRRDSNWRLMATRLDVNEALRGKNPCPADEIWLRDSDIVLVPKSPLLQVDDCIDLIFTRGAYAVFPIGYNVQFGRFTTLND